MAETCVSKLVKLGLSKDEAKALVDAGFYTPKLIKLADLSKLPSATKHKIIAARAALYPKSKK